MSHNFFHALLPSNLHIKLNVIISQISKFMTIFIEMI